MRKERQQAFETNSSSSHSITISNCGCPTDTLRVENGECDIFPGEFGWEIAEYTDAVTKASYCLTYAKHRGEEHSPRELLMLEKVVKDHTGAKKVNFIERTDEYSPWGYIDHQSQYECTDAFSNEADLLSFIFNPESVLRTDNDNH